MNILYYYPTGFHKRVDIKWLYGIDIIEKLEKRHPEWNFIKVDGSGKDIYKNIDVYLRPTRHDGYARMVVESQLKNIHVIWSYESGKYREPKLKEIEKRLESIAKNMDR